MLDHQASASYKSVSRRLEYICVRLLLAEMLPSASAVIDHRASGEPFIADGPHLSISHTKGYCCILLSEERRCGVDIEYIRPRVSNVADHFLRPDEKARDVEHQLVYWTVKEAVYKYFSADDLQFQQILVLPFQLERQGTLLAENMKTHEQTTVFYTLTDVYAISYTFGPL